MLPWIRKGDVYVFDPEKRVLHTGQPTPTSLSVTHNIDSRDQLEFCKSDLDHCKYELSLNLQNFK